MGFYSCLKIPLCDEHLLETVGMAATRLSAKAVARQIRHCFGSREEGLDLPGVWRTRVGE